MFMGMVTIVGIIASAIAAVAGFGIGSLLTPLVAMQVGIKAAVAAVSIPHLLGTGVRFWMLRRHVDRRLLRGFGLASAIGGLVGALLHGASNPLLTVVFAALLIFAGVMGLTGLAQRLEFREPWPSVAGIVSGLFGGLVGNQGSIRSAAMLGLKVSRDAFVATATAIALIVDLIRVPVYLFTEADQIRHAWPLIAAATAGVLVGTIGGGRALRYIPNRIFQRIVAVVVLALGIWMLFR